MTGPCSAQPANIDGDRPVCEFTRTKTTASDVVGSCRFCGYFACPHCDGPVCAVGDVCPTCVTPMSPVEALRWAVESALGGDADDEEEETVETPTLTDAQLLALKTEGFLHGNHEFYGDTSPCEACGYLTHKEAA